MEVNGRRFELSKCRMALWIGILVFAIVLPGVLTSHMSTIDERTGISPRDSVSNTRMSSRNTRNRSGIQSPSSASPSRASSRLGEQRGSNRMSERCIRGRTCDQSLANTRSSVRTNGRTVATSQESQRRGSSRTSSVSSRARVPSRTSAPSRASGSSRSRATPRNIAISRASEPARTTVLRADRVSSRSSTSSRGTNSNVPSRAGVAVRNSGSPRTSVSSRSRVPTRVSSRTAGSSVAAVSQRTERRPASSSRSRARSSSSSGVALREPSSSSGTPSRASSTGTSSRTSSRSPSRTLSRAPSRAPSRSSSRTASRGTSWRSSRVSSSTVGTSSRDTSRGTSRVSSRGNSVAVNRASPQRTSGKTSEQGSTVQRSNRGQRTRNSNTPRIRAVATNELRSRSNNRGSGNSGTGNTGNNVLPPSVNRFLNELKSSMPGSVGVGVGMSMANGISSNARQSTETRSRSSSSSTGRGAAVNQRLAGTSAGRTSGQRVGSRGSQRVVAVDRIQPIIQPIIRPTFNDAGVGIDNQGFGAQDNLLTTDAFMANDFSDPRGISVSGNDRNVFVDSQVGSAVGINDGFLQNSLDLAVPVSNINQGIIQNLDQFVPQQNQFVQDNIIPQNQIQSDRFTQGETQQNEVIRGNNQLFSQGQSIGINSHTSNDGAIVGVMNEQIQPNSQQIVMDMQGIQTQTRPVDPIVGIRHNVISTSHGQGPIAEQSVAADPIIRNDQFIQGNTVGNVFGRVNVQSQGHSPIQQVQQPIQQVQQPIQQVQQPISQTQQTMQQAQGQEQLNQSPVQPTFVNSNIQGTLQSTVGSNTMQVPQQAINHRASVPAVAVQDVNNIVTVNRLPAQLQSHLQTIAVNSPQQFSGQVQQNIGAQTQQVGNQNNILQHQPVGVSQHINSAQTVGVNQKNSVQHQPTGVSQSQLVNSGQTVGVNQNQFSTSINDMQQNFPIPNSPVHDQGQVQVQGQMVQDQNALGSSGIIGQFITPQSVDQSQSQVNSFQSNSIQTSGVIHPNQNVNQLLGSQLTAGQRVVNTNAGEIHAPLSHTLQQAANTLGAQTNAQAPLIQSFDQHRQLHLAGGSGSNTFTQPLNQIANQPVNTVIATGTSNTNTQPLIQTVHQQTNQQPSNAISGQVISKLQNAKTIHQIHSLLTGQPTNVVSSNQSPTGSIGTIGGQTFQGIAPAAPAQSPLLSQVTSSPNSAFNSITTPNPNKRMVIQIDPNSKGVKIVPDGMGGVRVISLREAVTVSPFGNDTNTGLMALLDTPTQSPKPPLSVPIGSSVNSQPISLTKVLYTKPTVKKPANWEAEPEINTGVTDIPEELEINGTSPDGTPPNAGLDAGALPTTPTVPTAAFLPVTAKVMYSPDALTTPKTPDVNLAVTEVAVSSEVPTKPQKTSGDDEEDESNITSSIETINIFDPFYGSMRRDLVRNTNVIQDLINKLAMMEYNKQRQAIDKASKKNQSADMMVNSVLAELVKLENSRAKEEAMFHNFVSRRSTLSTIRQAGVTPKSTTTMPTPVVNGTLFTGSKDTLSNNTTQKPLSIEDIHSFLHTFPNSQDILKRLTDIFANNKTSTAASTVSNITHTTRPTTVGGRAASVKISPSSTTATTRRMTQTSAVTKPTTIVTSTHHMRTKVTSNNGLPDRLAMTAVNGDISFGDESARRLNKIRTPGNDYSVRTEQKSHKLHNILITTTRKNKLFTTTAKPLITSPINSAIFSIKDGNRNSNVAVYGTQVMGSKEHHHVKEHYGFVNNQPGHSKYGKETTVRFSPMMTTSKTTQLHESRHWVTRHPGSQQGSATPLSMAMKMPSASEKLGHTYREEYPAVGTAVSGISPFLPFFGQDTMATEENNKRIEPNLNNIFSKALNIQSPNGMQIKQLPRTKRTSSGVHAIA